MRLRTLFAATTALAALPSTGFAQTAPAAAASATDDSEAIIVTARKRDETLADVPIAISAVTGDTIERRGFNSVRELATQTPGLNIASDGTGRAFVSIRGVGVTLVQSVQPGVGLFINGIYQPNTAYLNNPLVDIERVEVLRGPQGTLYGKNTLGGAINVISRQPSNDFHVRGLASFAGPDNSWLASGSVSGPIIEDKLQFRVGFAHRQQDGFITNTLIGGDVNKFRSDTFNGTLRIAPTTDVVLTINGYYDWVDGVNTPYARVLGPTDYQSTNQFNTIAQARYQYRGINAKLEFPLSGINTNVTLVGAYDLRDGESRNADADFGPADIARASGNDNLRTKTAELRFDTTISDTLSSLVGLFYSRETTGATDVTNIIPFGLVRTTTSATEADTYAVFGTVFWKPSPAFEVSLGMRYDHEDRSAQGTITSVIGGGAPSAAIVPVAQIKSDQVEPRLSLKYKFDDNVMVYGSVARGYRGGGFNAPTAPVRTYKGDSAWTYEVGTKFSSTDRTISLGAALFYSDYKDYIGLNSIAPAAGGGLVTVDLNTGDVRSYGAELEATFRPIRNFTLSGGLTYMNARLTSTAAYTAVTGRTLSSDRLTFQPDFTFFANADYAIPLGSDTLTLSAGVTGKGERLAATLNQTTPTFLESYVLTNASIGYKTGPFELSVFANNLFDVRYYDSYIEKTTLSLAGLPASDLGLIGDHRRIGARVRVAF
jgi:iron complex outermembrane receptor protein